MNGYIQVYIVFLSYLYGIIFYILAKYNLLITKNLSTLLKYLITFIFIIDIVIIYIYLIFSINKGIFHIYFLLSMFLGYLTSLKLYPKINKLFKKKK